MRDSGFGDKTEKECFYVISFFDCDRDGALSYTEFLSLVLPCDSAKLRSKIVQRANYFVGPDDYLSKSVEYELCMLICKEISLHNRTERLKQELTLNLDFTPEDAYKSIDDINYGYIDFNNLKRFLKKNKFIPTNKDLAAIIRRMDMDADSKLKLNEFVEGIKPVEPYSKCDYKGKRTCKSATKSRFSSSKMSKSRKTKRKATKT